MMRNMKPFSRLMSLIALLVCSQSFAADSFKFGIGATALGGYNWRTPQKGSVLPQYGGLRLGYGGSLEVRFFDLVGLELNVIQSTDRGDAQLSSLGSSKLSLGQTSWHLPVLVKVVVPIPFLNPIVMGGMDWVFPGKCKVEGGSDVTSCAVNNYNTWTVGLGNEFKLPIPAVDIRIPISIRYAFLREATTESAPDVPRSEWSSDIHGTAGASIYF